MTDLAELIVDAIGLVCGLASWTFIVILPIGFLTLAQVTGTTKPLTLTLAESLIAIAIGLLAQWLANGILKRGRLRMALACFLCALVGLRKIVRSLREPAVSIYPVAQAVLVASLFLVAALFLGVVLLRKRDLEV